MYLFLIVIHLALLAVLHQPVARVRLRLEDVLGRLNMRWLCHFRQLSLAELVVRLRHLLWIRLSWEGFAHILVDGGLPTVVDARIQLHALRQLGPVRFGPQVVRCGISCR